MASFTVVFADLTGSTGVFESLGNTKATLAITRLTQWIGEVCKAHGGYVVKYLGDGVLILFKESWNAVAAVTELHQVHQKRIQKWPEPLKMKLQVGMAYGEVVEQDGDYYGDAVNVASRLSDLSGPEQILVSDSVIQHLPESSTVRSRCIGEIPIRGRTEICVVHRIEWQTEILSEIFTVPAVLMSTVGETVPVQSSLIELAWLDVTLSFNSADLPIFLGRDTDSHFVLQDPRVSRKHAKIEWRESKFHLEDTSSYGTWIRFSDSPACVSLRRQECVLLQNGEIALGAPFEDFTVPTVSFKFYQHLNYPKF